MARQQDFRLALRSLGRDKTTTALAAVALALGLGVNVAIFSMVRLMLWTPLPYPAAARLVSVPQTNAEKGFRQASVSYEDVRDWRRASAFESLAVYQ
jgi:ATP:corrinoid adenosyltransferase